MALITPIQPGSAGHLLYVDDQKTLELALKYGMNIVLWTTAVTPEHYPLLRALKEMGYAGVELPITRGHAERFDELRDVLESEGLECTTLTNLPSSSNPAGADRGVRARAVDELKWVIDISHRVGSRSVAGPLYGTAGVFTGKGPTAEEYARSAEVLHAACAYSPDTLIALEFLNRFESYVVNTTAQAKQLARMVDAPNLRLVYDTHHAHLEESNNAEAIREAGPLLSELHFSESHRGTLGTGLVHWPDIVGSLEAIHFDGWVMVEAFAKDVQPLANAAHVWRDVFTSKMDVARAGLAFTKDCFSRNDVRS